MADERCPCCGSRPGETGCDRSTLLAERDRLRSLLWECYLLTGVDPSDDRAEDDGWLDYVLREQKRLRDEADDDDSELRMLADALEGLYDVYKPEGVGIWLKGAKRSLDGRSPLALIRAGEIDALAAMVERMRSGAAT